MPNDRRAGRHWSVTAETPARQRHRILQPGTTPGGSCHDYNARTDRARTGIATPGAGSGGRSPAARRGPPAAPSLETVGSVSERAGLGQRARGLQRRGHRLGLLSARPRPLPGLPVERGRPRRNLRSPSAYLLCPGALEPPRPDPQGADLRAERQRGQPRGRRQGVLLLSRQHAHALLHAVPLQVPAGRVPLRTAGRRKPPAREGCARVRADGHGGLRRWPLLRRRGGICKGRPGRPADRHPRQQPRTRRRRARPAPDGVVPEYVVVGFARRAAAAHGRRRHPVGTRAGRAVLRRALAALRGDAGVALYRERDQCGPPLRLRRRTAVHQGRVPPVSRQRRGGRGESRRHGLEGGGALRARGSGRGHGQYPAAAERRPARRRRRHGTRFRSRVRRSPP